MKQSSQWTWFREVKTRITRTPRKKIAAWIVLGTILAVGLALYVYKTVDFILSS